MLPAFVLDNFLNSSKPFEYVYKFHDDEFQESRIIEQMNSLAKALGFNTFKSTYKKYCKSKESEMGPMDAPQEDNFTGFDKQKLDLSCGDWIATDEGIFRRGPKGLQTACSHAIMPVEKLRNIDTNELKIRLVFRRGNKSRKAWTEIITDFNTLANAKNITSLAAYGVSVTSGDRAQSLSDYIRDVLDYNYDLIPEKRTVCRMGWNEEGFVPYIGNIEFDGNSAFERIYKSITQHGDFEAWRSEAIAVRKFSLAARIVLAASFASVLVGPMGCQPFFVHLWGMDSETGKTVAQMVAASVWAEPTKGGDYFITFRATTVGFEVLAGFLRSLPLIIDELQLTKDPHGKVIFNVYELESGSGKMRATKTLGIAGKTQWANCFITSGETPLTGEQEGAGALNRAIEIECLAEHKVIENGHKTAEAMKKNYGFAGKMFIERLMMPHGIDQAKKRYSELFEQFVSKKATEKQSNSAALIVLADQIATKWIFKDDNAVTVDELSEFLKSKEAISAAERGYDYVCDWVSQSMNKFIRSTENPQSDSRSTGDIYGVIVDDDRNTDNGYVYIIRSVWNKACMEAQISPPALLSHLRSKGLIQTRGRKMTMAKRINKVPTECVVMKMRDYGEENLEDRDDFIEISEE